MAVSWIAYSIENVLGQSKWKLIVLSAQAQIKVAVHCLVMRTIGNKQYMLNGLYKICADLPDQRLGYRLLCLDICTE